MKNDHIDNSFQTTLAAHQDGAAIDEASEKLAELVKAVCDTGRAGSLILTVRVSPAGKVGNGAVIFDTRVKSKLPEIPPDASIFFADDSHRLTRENPRQLKMELKSVEAAKPAAETPLKKTGAAKG